METKTKIFTGTLRLSPIGNQPPPIKVDCACPECGGSLYKKRQASLKAVCLSCLKDFPIVDGKVVTS